MIIISNNNVFSHNFIKSKIHVESNNVLLLGLSSLNLILEYLKKGELTEARNIITRKLDSTNEF